MADPAIRIPRLREQVFRGDLTASHIAGEAAHRGRAEGAAGGAADLGRDAERDPFGIRQVYRLDLLAVAQLEKVFDGTVLRGVVVSDARQADFVILGETGAESARKVGHFIE